MIHLFVEFCDHHRLDDGQQFSSDGGRYAKGITESEGRGQVPADHRAGQNAQLAAEASDQVPYLPTLMGERPVQPRRAVRAPSTIGQQFNCETSERMRRDPRDHSVATKPKPIHPLASQSAPRQGRKIRLSGRDSA